MLDLFWELRQQERIVEAQADGQKSQLKTLALDHRIEMLQQSIEKLALVNAAMWSLLQDRAGLKDDELLDRMQKIDMQDGVADGRIAPQGAQACAKCQRPISRKHERCMYCGADHPGGRNPFVVT